MEFKPIDKKDYEDIELWTMTSGFPFKDYPDSLDEDEFINLYTCNDYPDYLIGYGKILWNGELCDFTLIRTKMLDDICYDEFTTYSSPITIDEKKEHLRSLESICRRCSKKAPQHFAEGFIFSLD